MIVVVLLFVGRIKMSNLRVLLIAWCMVNVKIAMCAPGDVIEDGFVKEVPSQQADMGRAEQLPVGEQLTEVQKKIMARRALRQQKAERGEQQESVKSERRKRLLARRALRVAAKKASAVEEFQRIGSSGGAYTPGSVSGLSEWEFDSDYVTPAGPASGPAIGRPVDVPPLELCHETKEIHVVAADDDGTCAVTMQQIIKSAALEYDPIQAIVVNNLKKAPGAPKDDFTQTILETKFFRQAHKVTTARKKRKKSKTESASTGESTVVADDVEETQSSSTSTTGEVVEGDVAQAPKVTSARKKRKKSRTESASTGESTVVAGDAEQTQSSKRKRSAATTKWQEVPERFVPARGYTLILHYFFDGIKLTPVSDELLGDGIVPGLITDLNMPGLSGDQVVGKVMDKNKAYADDFTKTLYGLKHLVAMKSSSAVADEFEQAVEMALQHANDEVVVDLSGNSDHQSEDFDEYHVDSSLGHGHDGCYTDESGVVTTDSSISRRSSGSSTQDSDEHYIDSSLGHSPDGSYTDEHGATTMDSTSSRRSSDSSVNSDTGSSMNQVFDDSDEDFEREVREYPLVKSRTLVRSMSSKLGRRFSSAVSGELRRASSIGSTGSIAELFHDRMRSDLLPALGKEVALSYEQVPMLCCSGDENTDKNPNKDARLGYQIIRDNLVKRCPGIEIVGKPMRRPVLIPLIINMFRELIRKNEVRLGMLSLTEAINSPDTPRKASGSSRRGSGIHSPVITQYAAKAWHEDFKRRSSLTDLRHASDAAQESVPA